MNYKEINTIKQLADLLRCKSEFIESIIKNGYFIFEREVNKESEIRDKIQNGINVLEKFYIQKKNKSLGYRVIYKPQMNNLSNTLKILNNFLSSIYLPLDNIHGFVKGKNIRTNANMHLAKNNILLLDIKDFFDSISLQMIKESLVKLGFKYEVANWISSIVTVNGFLVQGLNTSPTIANIVAKDMDLYLIEKCNDSIDYTRYADDMYFSSNNLLPDSSCFESIIIKYGFKINLNKTKLMRRGQNQYVTGLTVFDNVTPRISKKIKRNLRLEIHYINKFGYTNHILKKLGYSKAQLSDPKIRQQVYSETNETENRIWGWIHFIQSIEPILGENLEKEFKKRKRKMYSKYILSCIKNNRLGNSEVIIQHD